MAVPPIIPIRLARCRWKLLYLPSSDDTPRGSQLEASLHGAHFNSRLLSAHALQYLLNSWIALSGTHASLPPCTRSSHASLLPIHPPARRLAFHSHQRVRECLNPLIGRNGGMRPVKHSSRIPTFLAVYNNNLWWSSQGTCGRSQIIC